jgi:hypothetical protein
VEEVVSASSSDSSGSPKLTPKSEDSTPADNKDEKVPVPPVDAASVSGGPPPPLADLPPATTATATATATAEGTATATATATATTATATSTKPASKEEESSGAKPAASASASANGGSSASSSASTSTISLSKPAKKPPVYYATSEGESSASPIEDWEELYSSDDMTRKPRMAGPPPAPSALVGKYADESEDENAPDPWNAICVVGIRVYSKDDDLELRVVMEGGQLEEGGMGEKGGVDLDTAQANAGGAR